MNAVDLRLFNLADLLAKAEDRKSPYLEFLRVPALSCGLRRLAAGERDDQTTHDEDEVYFVLQGKAMMVTEDGKKTLGPGSILYLPADSNHQIVDVEEDLSLLVFFGSGGPSGAEF